MLLQSSAILAHSSLNPAKVHRVVYGYEPTALANLGLAAVVPDGQN